MPRSGHRKQRSESGQNHRIARDAGPRQDGKDNRLHKKGLEAKQRKVQSGTAEEAREEDTKETAQFEHVDPEQATAAEQEQKIAENALHQAEAEAEIYVEEVRPMGRLEFAVEVVVGMLTHQEEFPQHVVRLDRWESGAGHFRNPVLKRRRREGKTDFHARMKTILQASRK